MINDKDFNKKLVVSEGNLLLGSKFTDKKNLKNVKSQDLQYKSQKNCSSLNITDQNNFLNKTGFISPDWVIHSAYQH